MILLVVLTKKIETKDEHKRIVKNEKTKMEMDKEK
jgi:hypothetical protein